jgi:hypothetical protein
MNMCKDWGMQSSRNWGKCGGLELATNVKECVAIVIDSRVAVTGIDEGGMEAAVNVIVEMRVNFIVVNQVRVGVHLQNWVNRIVNKLVRTSVHLLFPRYVIRWSVGACWLPCFAFPSCILPVNTQFMRIRLHKMCHRQQISSKTLVILPGICSP